MRLPGRSATSGEVPSFVAGIALGFPGWTLWHVSPMAYPFTIRVGGTRGWSFSRVILPEAALAGGLSKGLLSCRLLRSGLLTTLIPLV